MSSNGILEIREKKNTKSLCKVNLASMFEF